ncbi:MAG: 50S ribosomal protein L10 [Candidatus Paceibacterota bacterium]|jgi:large subunit ribosomal protein L10|nr:50S ribosomal protein L10 [Candidatus Paceibacterota bacterium]MDD5621440.1 50S ribosomal protein L10 [Candidatus Paceibacterota bacterium]
MPLTRQRKKEAVQELEQLIDSQKSMVFVNYRGLKAQEVFGLRQKLDEKQAKFKVVKKTLANIAFKNKGIEFKKDQYDDQFAIVFGYEDEIAPARILFESQKYLKTLEMLGGYLEKDYLDGNQVLALAQLPSRNELIAKLMYLLNYPMSGLVNVLSGNIKGLVYAINAISKK